MKNGDTLKARITRETISNLLVSVNKLGHLFTFITSRPQNMEKIRALPIQYNRYVRDFLLAKKQDFKSKALNLIPEDPPRLLSRYIEEGRSVKAITIPGAGPRNNDFPRGRRGGKNAWRGRGRGRGRGANGYRGRGRGRGRGGRGRGGYRGGRGRGYGQ